MYQTFSIILIKKNTIKKFNFHDIFLTLHVAPEYYLEYSKQVVLLCGQTSFSFQKFTCQLKSWVFSPRNSVKD